MKVLYNLKDKVIKQSKKDENWRESIENCKIKRFLICVRKMNSTNIIL